MTNKVLNQEKQITTYISSFLLGLKINFELQLVLGKVYDVGIFKLEYLKHLGFTR